MENSKNPNIKEFIKYLDQTLDMFDKYIPEEDFERRDSDTYKLFTTLFRMYDDISQKETTYQKHDSNISKIVAKHIENKKKIRKDCPKWENQNIDSDMFAQRLYREGLRKMIETENGPIVFTEDLSKKKEKRSSPKKIAEKRSPPKQIIESTFFTNGTSESESDDEALKYDKTDDIDTKLKKLKERLSKN